MCRKITEQELNWKDYRSNLTYAFVFTLSIVWQHPAGLNILDCTQIFAYLYQRW